MSSLRRFWAILSARNKEFIRDRGALAWNLIFPFFVVFGMTISLSGKNQDIFKIGVIGPVQALPPALASTLYVRFVPFTDEATGQARLRHHQIDLLVRSGEQLSYWINETSPKGYMVERILLGTELGRLKPVRGVVTGREIRYVDWLVSGLLAMNMMFSALFGVGYAIVRYRKNGVLKRFKATPLKAVEFLAAQVLSRMMMILAVFAVVYHGSDFFIHYQQQGSLINLYIIFTLGAACLVSLGLLVAARATSEELAGGLLNLFSWPMMLLSGVWFSLEGAPQSVKMVANLMPLTHVIDAARAVMTEGATLAIVSHHILILALMTTVFLGLGAWSFRWE
jgi:ABC-type multidrug transport system permease subunit